MTTFNLNRKTNELHISINKVFECEVDIIFNSKEFIINLINLPMFNIEFTNKISFFLPRPDTMYSKLTMPGQDFLYNNFINRYPFIFNNLEYNFYQNSNFKFIPNINIISDLKIYINILNEIFNVLSNLSLLVYLILILFLILLLGYIIYSIGLAGLLSIFFIAIVLPNFNKITQFILFLFSLFDLCSGNNLAINNLESMYRLLALGGSPLYILIYFAFDFLTLRYLIRKKGLEKRKVFIKIITRFLFVCLINIGIYHTNSIWHFLYASPSFGLWYIISTLINIFSSFLYNSIQRWIDLKNGKSRSYYLGFSFCRAIIDYIYFSSVCYSTLWILEFVSSYDIPYFNVLSFLLGLILYTPVIFFSYKIWNYRYRGNTVRFFV